ncbi:MAG: hypothetical protein KA746_06740 [Pyrinomonadaceae bacterium]|nr:hypothetical protein [Pyrinomonadaceae bacterium]MBP6213533.1 hypothetical protein [Pyrinomonadaceae bacterium]
MESALIRFENENVEGYVSVGTTLVDAMRQFGIYFSQPCEPGEQIHHCSVKVSLGGGNLSPETEAEVEHINTAGRKEGERLACEAEIIRAGDITIMTEAKKAKTESKTEKDPFVESFEAMPLEEKISKLLRLEAVALGETIEYVVNSPYKIIEKIGDVLAEYGMKIETEAKKASSKAKTEPAAAEEPKKAAPGTGRKAASRPKRAAPKE